MNQSLFADLYQAVYEEFVERLESRFASIRNAGTAHDIVMDAIEATSRQVGVSDPEAYCWTCAKFATFKEQRRAGVEAVEDQIVNAIEDNCQVGQQERLKRRRQGLRMSATLRDFVKACEPEPGSEDDGQPGLRRLNLQERTFLADPDSRQADETHLQTILRQMTGYLYYDADEKRARQLFDKDRARNRDLIHDLLRPYDVRGTVFQTLWDELNPDDQEFEVSTGANPDLRAEAGRMEELAILQEEIDQVRNLHGLVRFLVSHTDVFCPSPWRLAEFHELCLTANDSPTDCPISLRDIYYHVVERKCRFCQPNDS